jgi:uncharacterized delta-60 repeat protein
MNKISLYAGLCILIFLSIGYADDYYIQWADTIINNNFDQAWGVATDNAGNVIVTGRMRLNTDDLLAVKYTPDGSILWADTVDNGAADGGFDIAVDPSENILVTGYTFSTNQQYYTVKYDQNGAILWTATVDNTNGAKSVAVHNNRIFVTGTVSGDIYTSAYDSSGALLGTRVFDNGGNDCGEGIATDNAGNFMVTGYSYIDGDNDYIVIKYAPGGAVLWVDTIDNGGADEAYGISTDHDGNITITGSSVNNGNSDYFTVKYSPGGTILWADTIDNGNFDRAWSTAVDDSNNIIVTGQSRIGSYYGIYTVKYDPDGNILWSDFLNNGNNDYGYDVTVDNAGNIIVTGTSRISGNDQFFTVKYAPLTLDSLIVYEPVPDSLYANGTDSTQVKAAVFRGGDKVSGLQNALHYDATIGYFFGDVIEDTDTTYYMWYRAGDNIGDDTVWVFCGNSDSALTVIRLIDGDYPVIVWWDSLPDDSSSTPVDTIFGPYAVRAEIVDTSSGISDAWLYWNADSVEMSLAGIDTFSAEIPLQIVLPGDTMVIDYYIKARDASPYVYPVQSDIRTFRIIHYETSIDEDKHCVALPLEYSFTSKPNPVSSTNRLDYQLPALQYVKITIFDITGRSLYTLVDGLKAPGYYTELWAGEDEQGNEVPSGIYFWQFKAGDFVENKKIMIIK